MAEAFMIQPLTKKDKLSVILYRAGIGLSGLIMLTGALVMLFSKQAPGSSEGAGLFIPLLYASTGMSVFNIHLYIGSLKRALKRLYLVSLFFLLVLIFIGRGNPTAPLMELPLTALLLLPLAGSIAFIGAKEAYCFSLREGYVLAFLLPLYLVLWPLFSSELRVYGLVLSSLLTLFLALRKAVMPLSFDIGDKSRYEL